MSPFPSARWRVSQVVAVIAPLLVTLPVCKAQPAAAPARVARDAPREIATRSQLELSGIAWAGALGRYLVVSDDIRDGHDRKHAPLVFGLSREGVLDEKPWTVLGVAALNDLESITAGPQGTFFLTTSHSKNKHGTCDESRRKLLHVAVEGHDLKILGSVDLHEAHLTGGETPWPDGALDVEALAFRDGALYIGLKSPLAADGHATILKLANAAAVLKSGRLSDAPVTVHAQPRFALESNGKRVYQGISDMTFTQDGSLLVLANAPKGGAPDGGGALWKLPAGSVRESSPVLLERFVGLKPEGISISADGDAAIIVFDRDGQQPMWLSRRFSL